MKIINQKNHFHFVWRNLAYLFTLSLLLISWSVQATAPRIAPGLFGEERQVDVVGYQPEQSRTAAVTETRLIMDLLNEAFQAGGVQPVFDLLPSMQLAKYEFVVNEVPALISGPQDMTAKESKRYRKIIFYLRGTAGANEPVSLFFAKKGSRVDELYQAFDNGLQKIISSGKYLEVMQKHLGKEAIPDSYDSLLKSYNPGWK